MHLCISLMLTICVFVPVTSQMIKTSFVYKRVMYDLMTLHSEKFVNIKNFLTTPANTCLIVGWRPLLKSSINHKKLKLAYRTQCIYLAWPSRTTTPLRLTFRSFSISYRSPPRCPSPAGRPATRNICAFPSPRSTTAIGLDLVFMFSFRCCDVLYVIFLL